VAGTTELMPQTAGTILPDTNIFVHYARNDEMAQSIEQTYALLGSGDLHSVSIVTLGELRAFAHREIA